MRVRGRLRRFLRGCRRATATADTNQQRPDIVTVSEVNYFGLANYLIDHYGADARVQAARLTQAALREDDQLAAQDWLAVEHAIALLTNDFAAARH